MKNAPGSRLRDDIATLLRIHFTTVDVEVRIGATTADVIYVDDSQSIFPRKIAIEAKDWTNPLSSHDISEIYRLYFPALSNRQIDNLWIIGRQPLAGSPAQTVQSLEHVEYTTFNQFQTSLINFSPLLSHNISAFNSDESSSNFIETRVRNSGESLIDLANKWICGQKSGLIIYGGYGLGKTTFSKYLASQLSLAYLDNSSGRIPIRFSLGDIFYKQDIVSLVSSSLAAGEIGVQIKNFSYNLFLEMNRLGRLLLIFDGFDEMRHAIELEDFVFNFQQLKTLMQGDAKVIILGRPDAFLSTAEESEVLSALFENPNSAAEKLDLVEVGFFSRSDVKTYISGFVDKRNFDTKKREKINALIGAMPDVDGDNILSRPVQLKMFTSIIDDFVEDDVDPPTRYSLYETFIYRFIGREQTKGARGVISGSVGRDARARFMQNAAWWILNSKKENRFFPAEITRDLIPADIRGRHGDDAALREALIGSVIESMDHSGVLDKKGIRSYYFPHKSYIEFLVAQYFSYGQFTIDMYRSFIENVTPEILSFVEEGPATGIENLRMGLDHAAGKIPRFVIEAAAKDPRILAELRDKSANKANASKLYTYYVHLRGTEETADFLRRQIVVPGVFSRMLALINCAGDCLKETGDVALARTLLINFLTSIFEGHKLREYSRTGNPVLILRDDEIAVKAGALLSAVELYPSHISIFPSRLMDFSLSASLSTPSVELWDKGGHREIQLSREDLILAADQTVRDNSAAVVDALLARVGSSIQQVPIILRGEAEERYSLNRKH